MYLIYFKYNKYINKMYLIYFKYNKYINKMEKDYRKIYLKRYYFFELMHLGLENVYIIYE